MLAPSELAAQKRMTQNFIDADPTEIEFTNPADRVSDGAGGWIQSEAEPLTATVRMIPQSDKVPEALVTEGNRPIPDYIVLGMPEAGFERYATFKWRGSDWKIGQIHEKPDYALKGDVNLNG